MNCVKYLKRGWKRRKGREKKNFKKLGQAGARGGCLKKGGAGTPLRTMIANDYTSNCHYNLKFYNRLSVLRKSYIYENEYFEFCFYFCLQYALTITFFWFSPRFPKNDTKKYSLRAFTRQVTPIIFYILKQNDHPFHILRQSLYSPF